LAEACALLSASMQLFSDARNDIPGTRQCSPRGWWTMQTGRGRCRTEPLSTAAAVSSISPSLSTVHSAPHSGQDTLSTWSVAAAPSWSSQPAQPRDHVTSSTAIVPRRHANPATKSGSSLKHKKCALSGDA